MTQGLTLQNLRITHAGKELVQIDAHIPPGTVLSVMGPSGSGKSTLLSALTGNLSEAFTCEGRILLDDQDITDLPPHLRRVGILFQEDLLFPHLSVGQNLAFALPPAGGRQERRASIDRALAEVGLEGYADRDPATLSGGQKARVSLMRMLLSAPRALLLDEAFSGLDVALRAQIRALVFTRAREMGVPALMVTHDPDDVAAAGGPLFRIG